MKTGGSRLHLEIPRQGLALPGVSVELLVASATGSAAGGSFFCQHSDVLSYRFKFECYISIIMQEQYLRNRLQMEIADFA